VVTVLEGIRGPGFARPSGIFHRASAWA